MQPYFRDITEGALTLTRPHTMGTGKGETKEEVTSATPGVKHFQTHHDCGVDVCTCRTSQLVSLIVKLFLRIFTQFQNRLVAGTRPVDPFFC